MSGSLQTISYLLCVATLLVMVNDAHTTRRRLHKFVKLYRALLTSLTVNLSPLQGAATEGSLHIYRVF